MGNMRYCHTFAVKKDYQKYGLGKILLQSTLNYTKIMNVTADSLLPQLDRFCQWTGCQTGTSINRMYVGNADHKQINTNNIAKPDGILLQKFSPDILPKLKVYDRSIHGLQRDNFLDNWVNPNVVTTLVATSGDDIIGYGCIQPDKDGQYLGPLYADCDIVAESILRGLLLSVHDGQVVKYNAYTSMEDNVTNEVFGKVEFEQSQDSYRIFSHDPCYYPLHKIYMLSFYFVWIFIMLRGIVHYIKYIHAFFLLCINLCYDPCYYTLHTKYMRSPYFV